MKLPDCDMWMERVLTPQDPDMECQALFREIAGGKCGDVTPWTETKEMLEKEIKLAYGRINVWRNEEENKEITFEWNGRRWDAGKASLGRLEPVLAVADHLPEKFFWTDADNEDVPVDGQYLKSLGEAMQQAMVQQGFRIHERQRQMKQEISQMTVRLQVKLYQPGWLSAENGEAS